MGFSRRMVFGALADACRKVGNRLCAIREVLVALSGRHREYICHWARRKRGIEAVVFTVDGESGLETLLLPRLAATRLAIRTSGALL